MRVYSPTVEVAWTESVVGDTLLVHIHYTKQVHKDPLPPPPLHFKPFLPPVHKSKRKQDSSDGRKPPVPHFLNRKKADALLADSEFSVHLPVDELRQLPPDVALRQALLFRTGSLKEAVDLMDANGNRLISLSEFRQCLGLLGIDTKEICGMESRDLFRFLDANSSGYLSASEVVGYLETDDQNLLSETEKAWAEYANHSGAMSINRSPRWKIGQTEDEDKERVLEKDRQWIQEKEDIRRQLRAIHGKQERSEVMERLKHKKLRPSDDNQHFRRVKYVLRDMVRDRKLLHKTRLEFNTLFEKPKESAEELERKRQASFLQSEGAFLFKRPTELSNEEKQVFFKADVIVSPRERELRSIAKELGISQEHSDQIKKIFRAIGLEAPCPVDRPQFEQIAKFLSEGLELRKKLLDEWWRELASYGNGKFKSSVSYREFLAWTALQTA